MRSQRLSLVGMVFVVLLGGPGGVALAQEEDDQKASNGSFSASMVEFLDADDMTWLPGPPYGRLDDWRMVLDMAATDPRFSGTWTMVQNGHGFGEPGAPESFSVYAGAIRIDNDDGAWTGEVGNFHSEAYEHMRLTIEGEGAYANLTAIIDQTEEFGEFQGIVFEGGLPPLPDPIEPSAG